MASEGADQGGDGRTLREKVDESLLQTGVTRDADVIQLVQDKRGGPEALGLRTIAKPNSMLNKQLNGAEPCSDRQPRAPGLPSVVVLEVAFQSVVSLSGEPAVRTRRSWARTCFEFHIGHAESVQRSLWAAAATLAVGSPAASERRVLRHQGTGLTTAARLIRQSSI